MAINEDKLMAFLGQFVGDLGATMAAGNVVIGHNLGLYRALTAGPATPEELAHRTVTDQRYITEWLPARRRAASRVQTTTATRSPRSRRSC